MKYETNLKRFNLFILKNIKKNYFDVFLIKNTLTKTPCTVLLNMYLGVVWGYDVICVSWFFWIFFCLKLIFSYVFFIVLMCWCQKYFFKIKNIILIYLWEKNTLKKNRCHTLKHSLRFFF